MIEIYFVIKKKQHACFIIFVQQKKYTQLQIDIKHQQTDILTWLKLKPATPVTLGPASPPHLP